MTSPAITPPRPRLVGSSPAAAAAPFGSTFASRAPADTLSFWATASLDTSTPKLGRRTLPLLMSCGTTRAIVSTGIAKPMPADVPVAVKIAVLMPIKRPLLSSSGPPLLPAWSVGNTWAITGLLHIKSR
eukprot:GHRR01029663.1.p1 GENE.GHRR01029663.1~~GHRR01029663.1.p1  ORF type:complete len:129 (-),score=39.95 GHRR01029663.1:1187-1573(-)